MNASMALESIIQGKKDGMTPKQNIIADFIMNHPHRAVFMTTRELAENCSTSEATIVRFVRYLGYESYAAFIRELRHHLDSSLTLLDRGRIQVESGQETHPLTQTIDEEMANLSLLGRTIQPDQAEKIVARLCSAKRVITIGSRLSYSLAVYMAWTMMKIRQDVILKNGSDRTTIDYLAVAPDNTVVVIIATSRYTNELIRIGRMAQRSSLDLIVLTDSASCPLIPFSRHHLIAPLHSLPFLGSITALSCLINFLVHAMARQQGENLSVHQQKLEQAYLENDILFNPEQPHRSL